MMAFADKKFDTDAWSVIYEDYLNENKLEKYQLIDEEQVSKIVNQYDVLAPTPVDLKKVNIKNVYEQYKMGSRLNIEDIDIMLDIIKDVMPKYYVAAQEYFEGSEAFFYNMFVMKKELFNEYCNFLFTVLAEFDNRKDISNYSVEGYRTPGHLGERLFGVFLTYLKKQNCYKVGFKPVVFFKHTEQQKTFCPAFGNNNVPIIFSSNEFYLQFTSAAILSIVKSASRDYNYDIIILCKNISSDSKARLGTIVNGLENFSLRFCDVGALFAEYKLYESRTITVETYYRLAIPKIFQNYDKVIYLDGDLIVLDDIAKLFQIDIGNNYLGAVKDIVFQGNLNGYDDNLLKYYKQFNCCNILNFINAGVLIMNIKELRRDFTFEYLLNFAQQGKFHFQDQDLLNILCENRIHYLDYDWNFYGDPIDSYRGWVAKYAPREEYMSYLSSKANMKIIHYAGNEKPWFFPKMEYANIFWNFFKKSPYYECFLMQRINDMVLNVVDKKITNKCRNSKEKKHKESRFHNKFLRLLPKGTRRREFVKKVTCFFSGRDYIEPNYAAEGIIVKYKKK